MEDQLQAVSIQEVADAERVWSEVVNDSPDAWLWHTWVAMQFNLCAGEKFDAQDHSFFIYKDDKPVGVVPLVIQKKTIGDFAGLDASYYSGFLPWPCFREEITGSDREVLEDFAFEELERRARAAGAGHIRIRRTPPFDTEDEIERVERVALAHRYSSKDFSVGVVQITPETLQSGVRERYLRYHKKFSPEFDLTIAEGSGMTPELEEAYFKLHVKDAGGQFRSRESYTKQADTARKGEGFYAVATDKASGRVSGMVLVSLYHGAALDNSVAIDPDFADRRVGLLVRWRAIEELLARGVATYELGQQSRHLPSIEKIYSKKEIGIAEFKDGFSRGNERVRYEIEKFLDERYLHAYLAEREGVLRDFFEIRS